MCHFTGLMCLRSTRYFRVSSRVKFNHIWVSIQCACTIFCFWAPNYPTLTECNATQHNIMQHSTTFIWHQFLHPGFYIRFSTSGFLHPGHPGSASGFLYPGFIQVYIRFSTSGLGCFDGFPWLYIRVLLFGPVCIPVVLWTWELCSLACVCKIVRLLDNENMYQKTKKLTRM
jgi:hypothetical protein